MATILEEITARKRHDLQAVMENVPAHELYHRVERLMEDGSPHRSLAEALRKSPTGIIAEFKRKSPSKGWIHREARPEDVVPAYARAGAAGLSILTDEPYFGGCNAFVETVRPLVEQPILRKDFTIDEYQVFEAKSIGADAILLIAACLTPAECRLLGRRAKELELDVLLEIHEEREVDYLDTEYVTIAGVNNRNLHSFRTDINTSFRLSALIPDNFVRISESGLSRADDLRLLRTAGYEGFLMGEQFMKAEQPARALQQLIQELEA